MITNVWYSLRNDFEYPAADPENDTPQQALNREHLRGAHDREVVSGLFKVENFSGFDWTLVSVWYQVDTDAEVETAVNALVSDNPDQVRVLNAIYAPSGYPMGTVDQETGAFSYEPPVYPQYVDLLAYMPDVWNGDEPPTFSPATELTDVNLLLGQAPRELTFLTTQTPITLTAWEAFPNFWLLSWNAIPQPVDGYVVFRDGEQFGATTGTVFVTTQPGDYEVRAVKDGNRSVPSNIVTIT